MRTRKQLVNELKRVLENIANEPTYSERNANRGYLKGLLFALGVDTSGNIRLQAVLVQCKIFLTIKDKLKIEQRLPEVFE